MTPTYSPSSKLRRLILIWSGQSGWWADRQAGGLTMLSGLAGYPAKTGGWVRNPISHITISLYQVSSSFFS